MVDAVVVAASEACLECRWKKKWQNEPYIQNIMKFYVEILCNVGREYYALAFMTVIQFFELSSTFLHCDFSFILFYSFTTVIKEYIFISFINCFLDIFLLSPLVVPFYCWLFHCRGLMTQHTPHVWSNVKYWIFFYRYNE